MSRDLSKKNIYITVVVFGAMLMSMLAIAIYALAPQFTTIKDIDGRIVEIKSELAADKENELSDNLKNLQKQLRSAGRDLGNYIVSPSEALDLTVDISKIAKLAGVKELRSTNRLLNSYSLINECQHVREGRMQIDFKSSFSQFAELTNMLERNKPVIFIDYFKISRCVDDSSSHKVEMVLTFFVGQDSLNNILASTELNTVNGG